MEHTLVLVQPTADKLSRTYFDFNHLSDALKGICEIFENSLRDLNPGLPELTYDVADLFRYLDNLPDLSILILDPKTKSYVPYGKTFIKNKLFQSFQNISGNMQR